jgi:polysaccharide pyruvyl transferase WcaK-like protein
VVSSWKTRYAASPVFRGRAALLNDTTYWYHWGCTGTSTAIHQAISRKGYSINRIPIAGIHLCAQTPRSLDDFDDPGHFRRFSEANSWIIRELRTADVVVVNGEGSLHGSNPFVLALLYLTYASKVHLGKQVHIINHSCFPEDQPGVKDRPAWELYKKVYNAVDFVAVREPISHGLLLSEGIQAEQSFDCLPLYIRSAYDPPGVRKAGSIVIAGTVVVNSGHLSSLTGYIRALREQGFAVKVLTGANMLHAPDDDALLQGLRSGCPDLFTPVQAGSIEVWLDTIAEASLLVSGRFHHTIAAAMLLTPCVLLESNTPKNVALARVLGIAPPLSWEDPAIVEKLARATQDALGGNSAFCVQTDARQTLCRLAERNFLHLGEYDKGYDA